MSIWEMYYSSGGVGNKTGLIAAVVGLGMLAIVLIIQFTVSFTIFGNLNVFKDVTVGGNVGIGTTEPQEKLHVIGDVLIEGNMVLRGSHTIQNTNVSNSEQLILVNDGTGTAMQVEQKGSSDIAEFKDDGNMVMILKDGGNVGIGMTNPQYTLDVAGDVNLSTSEYRIYGDSVLSHTALGATVVSSSLTSVGQLTSLTVSGDLTVDTNTLKVDSTNNRVGLGTTTPDSTFHIRFGANENINVRDIGSNPQLCASTDGLGSYIPLNVDASNLILNQYGGNVGVGSATPLHKLDVAGNANLSTGSSYKIASADVLTATTLGTGVVSSSLTSVGTLTSLAVSGDLTVDTNTLKVDSTNNRVGINSSTPSQALDVAGNANLSTGSSYKIAGTDVLTATTLGAGVVNSSLTSVGTLTSLTVTGDLTVDTNTLKVDSTNNRVGINSSTPSQALDVAGNANLSTGSSYKIAGTDVLTATTLGAGVLNSSLTSVGTLTSLTVTGDLTVDTNTFKVDSTNNRIGFGTATPLEDFQIRTSLNNNFIVRDVDTSSRVQIAAVNDVIGAYTPMRLDASTLILNQVTSGNVGIGITNPSQKLDVLGNTNISGDLIVDTNTLFVDSSNNRVGINTMSPEVNLHVNSTSTSYNTAQGFRLGSDSNYGTFNYVIPATGTEYLLIQGTKEGVGDDRNISLNPAGGNVGIGTTNPESTSKLQVQGNIHSTAAVVSSQGTNSSLFWLNDSSSSGVAGLRIGLGLINAGSDFAVNRYNDSGVYQGTSIYVTRSNGNVGIGTSTAPTDIFEIHNGTGKLYVNNITANNPSLYLTNGTVISRYYTQATASYLSNAGNHPLYIATNGTERLTVLGTGNVGIGTINPATGLHVWEKLTSGVWSATEGFRVGENSGVNTGFMSLGWRSDGLSSGSYGWIQSNFNGSDAGSQLILQPSAGNVGIGNTNPQTELEVRGNIKAENTGVSSISNVVARYGGAVGSQPAIAITADSLGCSLTMDDTVSTSLSGLAGGSDYFYIRRTAASNETLIQNSGTTGNSKWMMLSDGSSTFGTEAAERVRLLSNGNFGIGTASPAYTLDVYYPTAIPQASSQILAEFDGNKSLWDNNTYLGLQLGSSVWQWQLGTTYNNVSGDWDLRFYDNTGASMMSIGGNGNVGIGTTNGVQAKLNVNGGSSAAGTTSGSYYYFNNTTGGSLVPGSSGLSYSSMSIYASNHIWTAASFIASSDRRIKDEIYEINDGDALNKLRAIKPSTYKYIDKISRTCEPVYGFIAQEVKEVLPYAVSIAKEFIPNIYAVGTISDENVVRMDKNHGLVIGDRIRIVLENSSNPDDTNVVTIINDQEFQIDNPEIFNASGENHRVFVYGKEVDDFHTLDKNAIFTVGVAATQELDRKVTSLENNNNNLESKVTSLETENTSLKVKVYNLETQLLELRMALRDKGVIG